MRIVLKTKKMKTELKTKHTRTELIATKTVVNELVGVFGDSSEGRGHMMTMQIAVKTGTTKALVKAWTMMTDEEHNAICDENVETGTPKAAYKFLGDGDKGAQVEDNVEDEPGIYSSSDF